MSEENKGGPILVSTEGLDKWEPHESLGQASWFEMDGVYRAKIRTAKKGRTKEDQLPKIDFGLMVLDEDAKPKEGIVYRTQTVGGKDKNGENNVRFLGDVLYSAGRTKEAVRNLAQQPTIDLDAVCKGLTADGKNICYIRIETGEYQGKCRSEAQFIKPEQYEEEKKGNTHRKPRKDLGGIKQPATGTGASGAETKKAAETAANGATGGGSAPAQDASGVAQAI